MSRAVSRAVARRRAQTAPDDGALALGIDIGGTKIAGAVVDGEGTILEEHRVTSPATDPEEIEDAVAELFAELSARHDLAVVGVGAAGYIDAARSTVLFAPNVAWRNEAMRSELERRVGVPVVVENDANAAAWGEFRFGAGHDVDDQLMVTVGTGVGGGLVVDGELYRGAFGIAGEVGHLTIVPDGRACGCGNRGCWEQYASGSALVKETRAAAASSLLAQDLIDRAGGDLGGITGPLITQAAKDGDQFAVEQLAQLGGWLGHGIAAMAAILDPAAVVVGGGVSEAGELLLAPARETFERNLTGRGYRPLLEIRPATLGNRAGVIGAADLARR